MSQSMVPTAAVVPPEFPQPEAGKRAEITLAPIALSQADYVQQRWYAKCPAHVTPDDIVRPLFWKHIARRVKVDALITCRSDAGLFDIDLRVVQHTGDMIAVQVIRAAIFTPANKVAAPIPAEAFQVQHIPNKGWGVRNKESGTWLIEALPSKDTAEQWLKDFLSKN